MNPVCRWAGLVLLFGSASFSETRGEEALFADRVAPLLETRCLRCHDAEKAKGGLSLATREAALRGGETLPSIVPNRPEESYLLDLVAGDDPQMPQGGDPLSVDEVDVLRRWIEAGAPWPEDRTLAARSDTSGPWWSLMPLKRPEVPEVREPARLRTPIDAFILHVLEAKGLTIRPEVDRRTLIRRLTFDLHGLPPTPEEIRSFQEDERPDAVEQLVDRLLASPRYGERWARHWLDVVHYADTHGYDKDKRRENAWRYRDYVITSLNEDVPFERFLKEQIAGETLFPNEPRATVATGFIAAGPWDYVGHVELREGTIEKEKTRTIDRDDMLANTMSTFTGMTVHCARCHDHKFDPITQLDYYRLQAVFAGVDRGDRSFLDLDLARRRERLEDRLAEIRANQESVARAIAESAGPDVTAIDAERERRRAELDRMPWPSDAPASPTNGYHSDIETSPEVVKWVQIDLGRPVPVDELRLIPARPVDFPDTPGFGFPLRFRVEIANDPKDGDWQIIEDQTAEDVGNPGDVPWIVRPPSPTTARVIRVTAAKLWPRTNDYVFALGELEVLSGDQNAAAGAVVSSLDSIESGRWSTRFLVDGFDSRRRIDRPEDAERGRERAEQVLAIRRLDARRAAVLEAAIPGALRERRDRLSVERSAIEAEIASLPPMPRVYALVSREPRAIYLLHRGDVTQPGERVGPGALACVSNLVAEFPDTADEGDRRAALADWLADRGNPLTWRSIVNRIWQYHFGRGLVETPNDFGRNGAKPSHPELLDWLAVEFRDHGGSWKDLHRLICLSAVYRQSSAHDPAAAAIDASNTGLWRQNRRRLEAEEIRDAVLAVSGRLDFTMGGPGFPLFRFQDDHSPVYDHDDPAWIDPPEGRRRSIYRFVVRSVPNPFLDCLDGADPNQNVPVRNETITALQALALLNDPFLLAQADAFAERVERMSDQPDDHVEAAFRLALGRPPSDDERAVLNGFSRSHGLPAMCRLVFNLNEFVFVD